MKTLLITGTSRGIGQALAHRYLDQGYFVVGCSRDIQGAQSFSTKKNYQHFALDLRDPTAVAHFLNSLASQHPSIYGLINNAAISSYNSALFSSLQTTRDILQVNVVSVFQLCQGVARLMYSQKSGRIINFSTVAVPLSLEGVSMYSASKAAVESLTRSLAKEFGPIGITINCVGPTVVDTDLMRQLPKRHVTQLVERQHLKEVATVDDVGNVVDFFLSEKSQMISGQTLYLGGFG
ncbi:MAG: SDR family oxidoreductase [Bdellovibrionales bacterium]|jgi:3-oxoacyl-[acyl-carrier protein] reductase|nr:SDR family oxidoreductase [Bdellovibrionales bacterium]